MDETCPVSTERMGGALTQAVRRAEEERRAGREERGAHVRGVHALGQRRPRVDHAIVRRSGGGVIVRRSGGGVGGRQELQRAEDRELRDVGLGARRALAADARALEDAAPVVHVLGASGVSD